MLQTHTTRELEEDMSSADMELAVLYRQLSEERKYDRMAHAVNRGVWGGQVRWQKR